MFKRFSKYPAFLLAALALLIAGCGGDEGVTKAEFIKQAEAICTKSGNAEDVQAGEYFEQNAERLKTEPPPPENVKTVSDIVRTIRVPSVLKELEELEALEMPEDDEEMLKKLFVDVRVAIEQYDKEPQLVWAGRAGNPLFPTFKTSQEYGFLACAEA